MHPAGADSYPVSDRLTAKFHSLRMDLEFKNQTARDMFEDEVHDALEYLGEYEHGSVDVEDVMPQFQFGPTAGDYNRQAALEAMADMLFDFVGYRMTVNDDIIYQHSDK